MLWIKEVEMVDSVDDIKSSRAIPVQVSTGTLVARGEERIGSTTPMPMSARSPSTMNYFLPAELPQNSIDAQQRLQISELQFDRFSTSSSFMYWNAFASVVGDSNSSPSRLPWPRRPHFLRSVWWRHLRRRPCFSDPGTSATADRRAYATVHQFLEETVEVGGGLGWTSATKILRAQFCFASAQDFEPRRWSCKGGPTRTRTAADLWAKCGNIFPQIVEENVDVMSLVAQERLQPTTVRWAICTCASSSGVYGEIVERNDVRASLTDVWRAWRRSHRCSCTSNRRNAFSRWSLRSSWRGDLGVDPSGRPPTSTSPTLMATAQLARHVHGDPDCLVSVRFGDGFGDGVSHTVPFHRGYALPHAELRLDLTGPWSENLMKFTTERECPFATTAERESVRDVKVNTCYIGADYDTELKSTAEFDKKKTYELPDRNVISFGAERFHCVEVLFQPIVTGKEASGFFDTPFQNVMKCDATSAMGCAPLSWCQVAQPFSKGLWSTWRRNWRRWLHSPVIFQRISWWTSLSEGTLSPHPQRGTLFQLSKRNCATLVLDYDTKLKSNAEIFKEKTFELPDGNTVGAKRFRCVKVFFQPSFTKKSQRIPPHLVPEQYEVWRVHPQGVVRQCRVVKGHDHVPGYYWAHDEGTHSVKVRAPPECRGSQDVPQEWIFERYVYRSYSRSTSSEQGFEVPKIHQFFCAHSFHGQRMLSVLAQSTMKISVMSFLRLFLSCCIYYFLLSLLNCTAFLWFPVLFLEPTSKPKVTHTDNAPEFGKSCEELSLNHCTSTTQIRNFWDCWESSAVSLERDICGTVATRSGRKMEGGFHGVLLPSAKHSRSPVWWEGTFMKGESDNHSKGRVIPFGALVEYHPISAKDLSRVHQFGAKVLRGKFLGDVLYAGRIWKGDMMVADIENNWRRWTHLKSMLKDSMQRKC